MKTNLSDKEFLKKTKKWYENQQFPFPHVWIKDLLSAKFAEEVLKIGSIIFLEFEGDVVKNYTTAVAEGETKAGLFQ